MLLSFLKEKEKLENPVKKGEENTELGTLKHHFTSP